MVLNRWCWCTFFHLFTVSVRGFTLSLNIYFTFFSKLYVFVAISFVVLPLVNNYVARTGSFNSSICLTHSFACLSVSLEVSQLSTVNSWCISLKYAGLTLTTIHSNKLIKFYHVKQEWKLAMSTLSICKAAFCGQFPSAV